MIRHFEPDRILLRIQEYEHFEDKAWLKAAYHPEACFRTPPELYASVPRIHGNIDKEYWLFQKNSSIAVQPAIPWPGEAAPEKE